VTKQFAHGGGDAGEDEGAKNGVGKGRGAEGDVAFAADALAAGLSGLHGDDGGHGGVLGVDFDEGRHFVVVLRWGVKRWRGSVVLDVVVMVVVCSTSSTVPVAKDVEVDFDLYFVDYFVIVVVMVMVVLMVVRHLSVGGVLGTSAGLDLLKPLLLAW
jgi:hypothetical protein